MDSVRRPTEYTYYRLPLVMLLTSISAIHWLKWKWNYLMVPPCETVQMSPDRTNQIILLGLWLLWGCFYDNVSLWGNFFFEPVCTPWHNYSLPAAVPRGLFTHAIISCDASRGVRHFTWGGAPPLRNPARNLFVTWTSQINTWPTFLIASGQQLKMWCFYCQLWTILYFYRGKNQFLRKCNKYPLNLWIDFCFFNFACILVISYTLKWCSFLPTLPGPFLSWI